jgi:hypothetical protein
MLLYRLLRQMTRVASERNTALYEAAEQKRRKSVAQILLADERAHNAELEAQLAILYETVRELDNLYGPFDELDGWLEGFPETA